MTKFICEYKYNNRGGAERHMWTCVGRHGAVHLHVSGPFDSRYSGGFEIHYRVPPDSMKDEAPSHEDCWLLHGACWHDGTSLYASEVLIPFWLSDRHDHERMFELLQREYAVWFVDA